MKAMIFAAGLGTRLRPLTDTLPKALVPVCGKPLIEYVCRKLKSCGIDEAVVNVHHFADMVEAWAAGQDIMTLKVSDERERLLETGGAVLHARHYLDGCGSFLIHNVDIISDLDLKWFSAQVGQNSMATLLVSRRESSRPYHDIDPVDCLSLAFSGIHIMSDSVFDALEEYASSHGMLLSGAPARFSIIDFYIWACARHDIRGVCAENLHMMDVGKIGTIEQAEAMLENIAL